MFAANYYEIVSPGNYVYAAFDSYLNYDGAGSKVGDTTVSSHSSNNEATAIHAMVNQGDNSKLYLIAINKTSRLINSSIAIRHPAKLVGGNVFQLTGKAPKVFPASPVTMNGDKLNYALPPYSVSTIVLH